MKALVWTFGSLAAYYSTLITTVAKESSPVTIASKSTSYDAESWSYFLQHLPTAAGAIIDYTGKPIRNQAKHIAILAYDVGKRDLQQCADALIRLRAEYLFSQKRYNEIAFRFTSGEWFRYRDYVAERRPKSLGSSTNPVAINHATLRQYLDIVYTYAGTQSLYRDLLPADDFKIGTVIITQGSPGHCCMIVDETTDAKGMKRYKLVESYMPAQSIYVLKNPEDGTAWYALQKGPITTASYRFTNYALKKFE